MAVDRGGDSRKTDHVKRRRFSFGVGPSRQPCYWPWPALPIGASRIRPGTRWEVVRLAGSPSVGGKPIRGAGRIGAGEWIETDATSRATVKVGEIGSVEVAPGTRLRVVTARPGEHRLALARGEIRAKISAPPKLFFVDTASGTAVDLGCEYTLDRRSAVLVYSASPRAGCRFSGRGWNRWCRRARVAGRGRNPAGDSVL
jgi:hypothetical protein